jgi:hypothetical protein
MPARHPKNGKISHGVARMWGKREIKVANATLANTTRFPRTRERARGLKSAGVMDGENVSRS